MLDQGSAEFFKGKQRWSQSPTVKRTLTEIQRYGKSSGNAFSQERRLVRARLLRSPVSLVKFEGFAADAKKV